MRQFRRGAPTALVATAAHGIDDILHRAITVALDRTDVATDHIGEPRRARGSEVDDTRSAHVPEWCCPALNVGVQRVGSEWAVRRVDVERGGRAKLGILIGLLALIESVVLGVRAGIFERQLRHEAVREDERRIAASEVALIDTLADEIGACEGQVVVDNVELVESSVDPDQLDGHAAHAASATVDGDPIAGVAARQDEFGGRRQGGGTTGVATGRKKQKQGECERGAWRVAHRREI